MQWLRLRRRYRGISCSLQRQPCCKISPFLSWTSNWTHGIRIRTSWTLTRSPLITMTNLPSFTLCNYRARQPGGHLFADKPRIKTSTLLTRCHTWCNWKTPLTPRPTPTQRSLQMRSATESTTHHKIKRNSRLTDTLGTRTPWLRTEQ